MDSSPLQAGIRRLLKERDEAREQVRLLMKLAETLTIEQGFPDPISVRLGGLWDGYYRLYRHLRDEEWFRERDR